MKEYQDKSQCPQCGEPVREGWKLCPACETSLGEPVCPKCRMPVKEHWKRCPECEAPLVCRSCGRRIPVGQSECPKCAPGTLKASRPRLTFTEPVTGMEFAHVPGGSFMMGDTFGDGAENERPVHMVQVDGFYMGRYQVTQAQWNRLMSDNPSKFRGDGLPVEQVTWHDAQAFVKNLTEANKGKYVFSLPSEAQWEYAARSGGKEERYAGSGDVEVVACYEENSDGMTHPVGARAPNGLGLYDMCGNVWEWCLDIFRKDAYKLHGPLNPLCTEKGEDRVIRGGSWNLDAWGVRCAKRSSLSPGYAAAGVGLRVLMTSLNT
ncbi:MAG: SUMF1/EgtB/PvdO family nonheme iron enzyme [Pseudomonadota bacterium]